MNDTISKYDLMSVCTVSRETIDRLEVYAGLLEHKTASDIYVTMRSNPFLTEEDAMTKAINEANRLMNLIKENKNA